MFYQVKTPPRPKYEHESMIDISGRAKPQKLVPWEVGMEAVAFNSRHVYSDGSSWKFTPDPGSPEWVKEPPPNYRNNHSMESLVFRTPNPRMLWSGYSFIGACGQKWSSDPKSTMMRPSLLSVNEEDVFPSGSGRNSLGTMNIKAAEKLFEKGVLNGVSWSSTPGQISVCFSGRPKQEELIALGWFQMGGGDLVDRHRTFSQKKITVPKHAIILPHRDKTWEGLASVSVANSAKEGVLIEGFTVSDPEKAAEWIPWAKSLPAGAKVTRSYGWSRHCNQKDAEISFKTGHLPPIKKTVQKLTYVAADRVICSRGGKIVMKPEDIDLEGVRGSRLGNMAKDGNVSPCFVTNDTEAFVAPSTLRKEYLVGESAVPAFWVLSKNYPSGRSRMRLIRKKALVKIPKGNEESRTELEKRFPNVVPLSGWTSISEAEYAKALELRNSAVSRGMLPALSASQSSAIPQSVFNDAVRNKAIDSVEIPTTKELLAKPVTFGDVPETPELVDIVIKQAEEEDMMWMVQMVVSNAKLFQKRMLHRALEASG